MIRRLQVLFLLALGGVLAMFAAVAVRLGGWPAMVAYLVIVVSGLALVARTSRRPAGRTCDCCTGTVHDPVKVL